MRRKTVLFLVGGTSLILSCMALRVSLSNDTERVAVDEAASFAASDEVVADAFDEERPNPEPARAPLGTPDPAELRRRFVDLVRKQSERMSSDDLGRSIENLTKTLADQDSAADAELDKAIAQLQSIAEKFPGTPAAGRAARAIEATRVRPISPRVSDDSEGDAQDAIRRPVSRSVPVDDDVGFAVPSQTRKPISPAKGTRAAPRRSPSLNQDER